MGLQDWEQVTFKTTYVVYSGPAQSGAPVKRPVSFPPEIYLPQCHTLRYDIVII